MRFDQVTIPLVPRTVSNCLDLAVLFFGRHSPDILSAWAFVAFPAGAAVFYFSTAFEMGLPLSVFVLLLACPILGVLLMAGTAAETFGEPMEFPGMLLDTFARFKKLLVVNVLLHLAIAVGAMFCIYPGAWLAVRYGFLAEEACLSRLSGHLSDRRTDELVRREMPDLMYRGAAVAVFCSLLWAVIFFTLDILLSLLFGVPIFSQRLTGLGEYGADYFMEHAFYLLYHDPRVLTLWTMTGLLVYPIGRLAWFFCYIDMRVRRDMWDMELRFIHEAERLEARG
jgi:hypothetical protein